MWFLLQEKNSYELGHMSLASDGFYWLGPLELLPLYSFPVPVFVHPTEYCAIFHTYFF